MNSDVPREYRGHLKRQGFILENRVGRGAFGSVYKGIQSSLSRAVAVKFFDSKFIDGPAERKRFEREALLLARIEHPSIPFVLTSGQVSSVDPAVPYFVMQFIDGISLAAKLEKSRLSLSEACRVIDDVLDALGAAHACNVIH